MTKSKKQFFLRLPLHIKEMMRMNDDDSSVVDDGDGVGITMVMWAKMVRGRTTKWLRIIIRMMV